MASLTSPHFRPVGLEEVRNRRREELPESLRTPESFAGRYAEETVRGRGFAVRASGNAEQCQV